jgi:mannose-6-phosphate isomerase-like protein (cupin superfamily)
MSDYMIKNLMDCDDLAAGMNVDVEARFARDQIDSEHLGVSLLRYGAGLRSPFGHKHREQEEAYVVIGGSGRVKLGDEIKELKQWDVLRVAPEVIRAFEGGPDGLKLIAVGNDRPEGGDGERIEAFWPAD